MGLLARDCLLEIEAEALTWASVDIKQTAPSLEVMRGDDPALERTRLRESVETLKVQLPQLEGALGILRTQALLAPVAAKSAPEETTAAMPVLDLFVSQTERDEPLVKALLDLIDRALKIPTPRIRCTSIPGYKPPGGADVSATLKREIRHCIVFLAVLTEASNESFYVASEIGARWDADGTAILLRGCGFTPQAGARSARRYAFAGYEHGERLAS